MNFAARLYFFGPLILALPETLLLTLRHASFSLTHIPHYFLMEKMIRSFLPLLFAVLFVNLAQAQTPKISIQGTLKTADGASVGDGTYNVTFRLYNELAGVNPPVWFEEAMVEVIGGIYSHYLGSVIALNPANFANTLYLGVKVGNYELTPRTELAYSPYSFSVAVAQKVVCSGAVGDVKHSILNPTQFAAVNGACWVPMDGRSIAGSELATITGLTNVPDAGGLFIRSQEFSGGANQDPDRTSSSTIATYQDQAYLSHNHSASSNGSHTHGVLYDSGGGGIGTFGGPMLWFTEVKDQGTFHTGFAEANGRAQTESEGSHSHTIGANGGTETRPKNLNLWVYIRIN
jgi:hypothetical protein